MTSLHAFLTHRATRRAAGAITLLLAAIIVFLSVVQPSGMPAPTVSDKLKHFLAYGALAMPFCIFMGRPRLWLAFGLTVALGISMEIAQAFAGTGRSPSVLDAVANTLGAGISAASVWFILRSEKPRAQTP